MYAPYASICSTAKSRAIYRPPAQVQEDNSETVQEVAAVDSDKEYTLESIEEFNCYGNINPNDNILKGIDYRELYYFVKDTLHYGLFKGFSASPEIKS